MHLSFRSCFAISPNFGEPSLLFVDTSSTQIYFTLAQFQNGKEVFIAYNGPGLNQAEQILSTTEREAIALVDGIGKFQPYLHNYTSSVVTYHSSYHSSLRWAMNFKDASDRLTKMGVAFATV